MTEKEIKTHYKALHDDLSYRFYTLHEMPKEDFDQQHGGIWQAMEQELIEAGYMSPPKPRLVFEASPPGEALGERLKNIEDFLVRVYK